MLIVYKLVVYFLNYKICRTFFWSSVSFLIFSIVPIKNSNYFFNNTDNFNVYWYKRYISEANYKNFKIKWIKNSFLIKLFIKLLLVLFLVFFFNIKTKFIFLKVRLSIIKIICYCAILRQGLKFNNFLKLVYVNIKFSIKNGLVTVVYTSIIIQFLVSSRFN